jgi:predicted kinase
MNNNTLFVTIGLPASGKSTWAKDYQGTDFKDTIIVSTDRIRAHLYGDERIQGDGNDVFNRAYSILKVVGENGYNAVFDATNLMKKYRKRIFKELREFYDHISAVYFDVPTQECVERDEKRERKVGEDVIMNMATRLYPPEEDEGWDWIYTIDRLP